MLEGVTLSGKKFAHGLDRLISDPKFREALKTRPIETLPEIGIEIADPKRAHLVGEKLALAGVKAAAAEEPNEALVVSAVEVSVEVVVLVVGEQQVGIAVEEIQRANIGRLQEALSRRPKR